MKKIILIIYLQFGLMSCIFCQTLTFSTAPILDSGPPLSVGSVYRFQNGGVIGSTQTDLLVTVLGFSIPNMGISNINVDGFGSVLIEVSYSLTALTNPLPAYVDLQFQFVDSGTYTPKAFGFTVQSFDIDSSTTVSNNFTDFVAFTGHYGSSLSISPATALVEDTVLFPGYSAFYMPDVAGEYPDVNIPFSNFVAQKPHTAYVGYSSTSTFLGMAGTLGLVPGTQRGTPRGIVFNFNQIVDLPPPIPEQEATQVVMFALVLGVLFLKKFFVWRVVAARNCGSQS